MNAKHIRRTVLPWIPAFLVALLYGVTFIGNGLTWYDPKKDSCLIACHGWIVSWAGERGYPIDTLTLARLLAKRQAGYSPGPFSGSLPWSRNIRIPLMPFLTASLLPPLFATGVLRRWRFWKEIAPIGPFLFLTMAVNGYAFRESAQQGFVGEVHFVATLIEAIGTLCITPVVVIWAVALPRNVRERRDKARRLGIECVNCGYLLKGLTEPRCPECGERFEPKELGSRFATE